MFELEFRVGVGVWNCRFENLVRNILIPCLGFWVFELELVNVANVKISSSNVANFQLGIGIGIGNISTMATFTSV